MERPDISVVIIGINVERYIGNCIRAVQNQHYDRDKIQIIYVDGGSSDHSVDIAGSFSQVEIICLDNPHPTPGRGRNAGFAVAKAPLVQFLDADSYVHPSWMKTAAAHIKDNVAAVWGGLEERYPEKNIFHVVGNLEWQESARQNYQQGGKRLTRYFGGNVLVRADAIAQAGGFDETLVAGEDPDMSYRVRQNGWHILRISDEMVSHDLNMNSWRQYFRRAMRSGYAYAEIGLRYRRHVEKLYFREFLRIILRTILILPLMVLGLFPAVTLFALGMIVFLIFRPFMRIAEYKRSHDISWGRAAAYATHLSLAIFPQFAGILRYFYGRFTGNGLKNKRPQRMERTPSYSLIKAMRIN